MNEADLGLITTYILFYEIFAKNKPGYYIMEFFCYGKCKNPYFI